MKFAALGDSITYGFPFSTSMSWVAVVEEREGVTIINCGMCGDITANMVYRFDYDVLPHRPDYLIILGGANDAYSGIAAEKVAGNIEKICSKSRMENIEPVIGLPTPVAEYYIERVLKSYRSLMKAIARDNGYRVIDFYSALLDPATGGPAAGLTVDGVHPSIEGYERMAEAVDLKAITNKNAQQ